MSFLNGMTARYPGDEKTRSLSRTGARRMGIAPPRDREEAFVGARRRSSRVRFLRRAILIGGLGGVAAIVAIAIFNPFAKNFGSLSFSSLSVEGSKLTMARPRLSGFRSDGQPYAMTADKALQDVKHPTVIELQKVTGEIGASAGQSTQVSADSGLYDSVAETMRLTDNVRIGSTQFEVRLRSADINFKTGVYKSDEPVEVHMGQGTTIFGDQAMARNNGKELTFEGHVRTRIIPQSETAADDASGSGK